MSKRWLYNFIAVCIVVVILSVMVAMLGCASVEYTANRQAQTETLEVKTLFKSLDGLWSERGDNGFRLVIDKTYTHDPMRGITELLKTIDELRGMGIRYDPSWRSPVDPND